MDVSEPEKEASNTPGDNQEGEDEKKFVCAECNEEFMFHRSYLKHMQKVHSWKKPHVCIECGKNFSNIHNLRRHMLIHTGEKPHVCPLCKKCFAQDAHLSRHLRKHFDDRPFQCPTCSKRFIDKVILKNHMRVHTGEKPFKCKLCDRRFSSSGNQYKHLKVHMTIKQQVFKCTYCEKEFTRNSSLHAHMRVHNPEKDFECPYCHKKYSSLNGHVKHMKLHERDGNYGVLRRRTPDLTGEKKFKCSVCDKKFYSLSGQYKHMKTQGHGSGEMNDKETGSTNVPENGINSDSTENSFSEDKEHCYDENDSVSESHEDNGENTDETDDEGNILSVKEEIQEDETEGRTVEHDRKRICNLVENDGISESHEDDGMDTDETDDEENIFFVKEEIQEDENEGRTVDDRNDLCNLVSRNEEVYIKMEDEHE